MQFRMSCAVAFAAAVLASMTAASQPKKDARPDLSGFWALSQRTERDAQLMGMIAPNTVVLEDTGAPELPMKNFGGLKVKPKALEAALKWKPEDDMTISNACKAPSIVYATQGPFPMEIHQGTEFIIFKMEYYDMVRIVFMDGRKPPADAPHSKTGYSTGRWEGSTLVVETSHLAPATITNNGLEHSDKIRVIERFRLSNDGKTLLSTIEFEDPEVLDNRGARFIAWRKQANQYVFPYECDPTFAQEYQKK
jgi:hypothetical protein